MKNFLVLVHCREIVHDDQVRHPVAESQPQFQRLPVILQPTTALTETMQKCSQKMQERKTNSPHFTLSYKPGCDGTVWEHKPLFRLDWPAFVVRFEPDR